MIIVNIFIGLLILSILVFVHELGHFLVAKFCKVAVLEFAVGFGRKLWTKRIGDTNYSLRLIPLGGYVRMFGDNPYEEGQLDLQEISQHDPVLIEKLQNDKSCWFIHKGFFSKSAIVIAGPLFNVLFAWILTFGMFMLIGATQPINEPIIGDMVKDMPAEKSGLLKKDKVLEINGKKVFTWNQLAESIAKSDSDVINLKVQRENKTVDIAINRIPEPMETKMLLNGGRDRKMIGIRQSFTENLPLTIGEAFEFSSYQIVNMIYLNLKSFKLMIEGFISPKHIGGPIAIVKEAGNSVDEGFGRIIAFMVFLSISLAVMNMLPIPVLDGGHLLFFIIELFIGKPKTIAFQKYANKFGMVVLLSLMLFALSNDLKNLFFKGS